LTKTAPPCDDDIVCERYLADEAILTTKMLAVDGPIGRLSESGGNSG